MTEFTLSRVIFQRQKDGSFAYDVIASYDVVDPVTGETAAKEIGPFTPAQALEKCGIDLAVILDQKTAAALLAVETNKKETDKTVSDLTAELEKTKADLAACTQANNVMVVGLNQLASVLNGVHVTLTTPPENAAKPGA